MEKVPRIQISLVMFFIISLFVISINIPALAHKATIFAWVEGDTVFTESKFSGGKKAINAQVFVFDRQGKQLVKGKTNNKGEFSFKIPKLTDLRIVLNAGMGHKAEWIIPESEIREASGLFETERSDVSSQPITAGLNKEEVRDLIEKSLDKKLGPIIRMLTESQAKGPSITEIVGGIGYIFGLMGVALYFKNRGKQRHRESKDD